MKNILARATLRSYHLVGSIIYPFMGPFLAMRARRGKEDRQRRYERYGYPSIAKPEGPLVWFHAASVGEALAVTPLVEYVSGLGVNTILTTGTVTSAQIVKDRLPGQTFHQYVPLDLKPAVDRFLNHWKPDLAVFTESEIWPMTVMELKSRRIPQILVNARMSDRSFARWQNAPKLAQALFGNFSLVAAQSQLDAQRYKSLGARPVSITGNLKVDTDAPPCDEKEFSALKMQIGHRPTWVAASTHRGEEQAILAVHKDLVQKIPNILTVIVPRHPDRGDEVQEMIKKAGLSCSRRTAGQAITAETQIYLGDTIGEMGMYLRLGSVAFVGRSLKASGGQNPLEPALTGVAILSGQNVHNFREAYRCLLKLGGARLVRDEEMLAANVAYLITNAQARSKMVEGASQALVELRGALERTKQKLDAYIFPLTLKRDLESNH